MNPHTNEKKTEKQKNRQTEKKQTNEERNSIMMSVCSYSPYIVYELGYQLNIIKSLKNWAGIILI